MLTGLSSNNDDHKKDPRDAQNLKKLGLFAVILGDLVGCTGAGVALGYFALPDTWWFFYLVLWQGCAWLFIEFIRFHRKNCKVGKVSKIRNLEFKANSTTGVFGAVSLFWLILGEALCLGVSAGLDAAFLAFRGFFGFWTLSVLDLVVLAKFLSTANSLATQKQKLDQHMLFKC